MITIILLIPLLAYGLKIVKWTSDKSPRIDKNGRQHDILGHFIEKPPVIDQKRLIRVNDYIKGSYYISI